MNSDTGTLDAATLLKRIRAAFPTLRWKHYQLIDEGWDHLVVILDERLVFRFALDHEYQALQTIEHRLLAAVRPLVPASLPDYTFWPPDGSFVGYAIVAGRQLRPAYFRQLPVAQQTTIAHQLAGTLSVLHTLPARGIDISFVPAAYLAEDQAQTRAAARKHLPAVLSAGDYRLVENILDQVDAYIAAPAPATFVHNDIYDSHLLWDAPTGRLGLFDWSDMSLGDPAIDFGEIHEYGRRFVETVYEHYDGPQDDTFLERAWAYQQWAGVYMMTDHFLVGKTDFATARQIFDRIKHGNR